MRIVRIYKGMCLALCLAEKRYYSFFPLSSVLISKYKQTAPSYTM